LLEHLDAHRVISGPGLERRGKGVERPIAGVLGKRPALIAGDLDDRAADDLDHAVASEFLAERFEERREEASLDLAPHQDTDSVQVDA
jgi:hypothetical protein